MQVDELLKPFPIKEFHPFPRAMMGPGAHEMIGPEALKLGFKKTLVMTSGLRGSDIIHKIVESMIDSVRPCQLTMHAAPSHVLSALVMSRAPIRPFPPRPGAVS